MQRFVPLHSKDTPSASSKCAWRSSISKPSNWLRPSLYIPLGLASYCQAASASGTHHYCPLHLLYLRSQRLKGVVHGDCFDDKHHGGNNRPLHHRREEPAGGALASTRRQVLAQVYICPSFCFSLLGLLSGIMFVRCVVRTKFLPLIHHAYYVYMEDGAVRRGGSRSSSTRR